MSLNTDPRVRAEGLLIGQYQDSVNLKGFIDNEMVQFSALHTDCLNMLTQRTLENAVGYNLEVLGEIVGQPRGYNKTINGVFFGFFGAFGSDTFGTVGDAGEGGIFKSVSDREFDLTLQTDEEYRRFIKVRIIKNKSNLNIDDMIDIVLLGVQSTSEVTVTENSANFVLTFSTALTEPEKLLLTDRKFLPKPVGVTYTLVDTNGQFN